MSKEIIFEEEAYQRMVSGMNKVADAVKITFGPKGRNTAFSQQFDVPLVTNDGYTIARQITLSDKFENLGAKILSEASIKSNDLSGDGTTAAVVIAQALINESYKNIAAGANPIFLKRGMDKAGKVVEKKLDSIALKVSNVDTLRNIATISGNNDSEIGNIIGDIYDQLGFDPVISLMDTQMADTKLVISHGTRLDSGYLSRYFLTDTLKEICEIEDPAVFVCRDEITDIDSIFHLLEECVNAEKSVFIVARDIKDTAITSLAKNAERGVLKVVAIKGPGYSDTRNRNLDCLAAITGATVVDSAYMDISTCGLEVCGSCKKVISEKGVTTVEQPACPDSKEAKAMRDLIAKQLETEAETYSKDKLEQSLGILNSAMAVIEVGGTSELEMFERKYRIEDAVNAAKSAVKEGVVPGGGKALLLCIDEVAKLLESLQGDEATGAKVVLDSLCAPIRQIAKNCGVDDSVVLNTVLKNKDLNFGYNALTGEYGDLFKLEIIDPVAVIKNSFNAALSIAGTYITAGAAVCDAD